MHIQTHPNNKRNHQTYLQVQHAIHSYLQGKGYMQIDLPVLSSALIPESYIEIFKTQFTYFEQKEDLYLTPSPELFLKRLIVDKVGDCYYLGKSFRNSEPNSPKHNPEFTMLEFYKIGVNYLYIADEIIAMMRYIAQEVLKKDHFMYKGKKIDLSSYEKLTVAEAFQRYSGIDDETLFDHKNFLQKAQQKGYKANGFTYEDVFSQIYTQEIEPHLGTSGRPTVLCDYPVVFAPLSLPNPDGRTAHRFEVYIEGVELGNCYGELTDPNLQKTRLEQEEMGRKQTKKINHKVDWEFITALEKGMPDCSGIAMGVERLAMIVADLSSIDELQMVTIE